ncbi:hypothetical protein DYB31_012767, partial [Aphanomyces astaci]
FTGVPAKTPLAGFVHPTSKEVYVADWLSATHQKHVTYLQVALEEMHRNVTVRSDKLRQQARGLRDRKSQVKFAGFSVGDFVLVGLVVNRPMKLALHWRGQVTRVITDHVMETQQLVTPYEVTVHHACRLKMYHEGGREVTKDLEAQIAVYICYLDEGPVAESREEARDKSVGQFVFLSTYYVSFNLNEWNIIATMGVAPGLLLLLCMQFVPDTHRICCFSTTTPS